MENMSEAKVKAEFSFAPSEIHLLGQALRISETFTCPIGTVASGDEGLLMLLKRFTYPCRLSDMAPCFTQSVPEISFFKISTSRGYSHITWTNLPEPSTRKAQH